MYIFLFQLDDTIFSNLNTNSLKKFKLKKVLNFYFFLIAGHIIDYDFEELQLLLY